MGKRNPTILEKLNYIFGTGSSDISEATAEEIIEYNEKKSY